MKGFRIKNWYGEIVFKSDTLKLCYDYLIEDDKVGLDTFLVEDLQEDMEIDADEIVNSFLSGEHPEDLYFF